VAEAAISGFPLSQDLLGKALVGEVALRQLHRDRRRVKQRLSNNVDPAVKSTSDTTSILCSITSSVAVVRMLYSRGLVNDGVSA
jgi:hypothetical protein